MCVLSLPLFFCDCLVLCQFYSGTVFLFICVYVTVLLIEEKKKKKKKKKVRIGGDFGFFCSVFAQP